MLSSDLTSEAQAHQAADGVGIVGIMALKEHQFGNGTFNGLVVAADDSGFLKMVAAVVSAHLYGSLHTLTDIDNDLSVACSFF